MSKGQTLQDPFLNSLRKERIPVSIFLVNGIKLQGHIESFDQYVVLLKNTVSQMVYKHAISTVVPARNPRPAGAPAGLKELAALVAVKAVALVAVKVVALVAVRAVALAAVKAVALVDKVALAVKAVALVDKAALVEAIKVALAALKVALVAVKAVLAAVNRLQASIMTRNLKIAKMTIPIIVNL